MNTDDFEKQLQRQTIRRIPGEWRAKVLQTAVLQTAVLQNARIGASPNTAERNVSGASWWRELLWPCPQAWAGLAAVWIFILSLNSTDHQAVNVARSEPAGRSPELLMAIGQQRRLLAELIELPAKAEVPRPFVPRPRSEGRVQLVVA